VEKNPNILIILLCLAVLGYLSFDSRTLEEQPQAFKLHEEQAPSVALVAYAVEAEPIFTPVALPREQVHAIASTYIGTREHGGLGRGAEIEMFLRSCALGPGHHWCGCFTKYVFTKAEIQTPGANGWSPSWFPSKRITTKPQRGDVFSTYSIKEGRINHVGFVADVYGSNVETVEGNVGRRRNGYSSVAKLIRSRQEIHSYANWID
jgi:hypothetical protein